MLKYNILLVCLFIVSHYLNGQDLKSSPGERYTRGWEKLKKIDGHAGENVIHSLEDISPDLGRYIIEYVFGDVYCREAISDKEREVAVVGSLTAMGNVSPQLKVHLHAALNVGCTPDEIVQIINQTAPYAGIPASLNALGIFKEVLKDRGIEYIPTKNKGNTYQENYESGLKKLKALKPEGLKSIETNVSVISPDMYDYVIYTYGYLFREDILKPELRQLATIASLTAMGTAKPQLKLHIEGALAIGVSPEKIREVIITMSAYAGFPAALNGLFTLKEILNEQKIKINTNE